MTSALWGAHRAWARKFEDGGVAVEKLLSPQEAASLLGIKLCTVYTWAYRRQIPSQKVGRLLKFSPSSLEKWLKEQERKPLVGGGK